MLLAEAIFQTVPARATALVDGRKVAGYVASCVSIFVKAVSTVSSRIDRHGASSNYLEGLAPSVSTTLN